MPSNTIAKADDSVALTLDPAWEKTRARFLEAISPAQREAVAQSLHTSHQSGPGLKAWLNCIASGACVLPDTIPPEVIQVYLEHGEAMPLHDCEDCGMRVPVMPSQRYGYEDEPQRVFFPACPRCGGRTGRYLFWARTDHE